LRVYKYIRLALIPCFKFTSTPNVACSTLIIYAAIAARTPARPARPHALTGAAAFAVEEAVDVAVVAVVAVDPADVAEPEAAADEELEEEPEVRSAVPT